MARGRAFNSDASGSVPHGGCGQGGTVPPPSSSESSLASQSPTALAFVTYFVPSLEPRNKLSLVAGHIYPSSGASRQIMRIINYILIKMDTHGMPYHKSEELLLGRVSGCEKAVRSSSACLKRYGRASKKLGRILHSTESAEKYGREPTLMEMFTYTHTKDHDCHMFVDRRALSVNERQLAELRAHVMRLSGQPTAGTSSSDPLPTTDRDISTAQ
ncbi:hypothetical protein JCGZ_18572 [Jatropha curcas]|uniref:Uncharacterized protein n=1 Tax=Jatropha curcas TaxID=180498 RepID=A0A067K4R0_JATCU|nr:hypothetical protein JCGZ_18572 [Jatropha curcas]